MMLQTKNKYSKPIEISKHHIAMFYSLIEGGLIESGPFWNQIKMLTTWKKNRNADCVTFEANKWILIRYFRVTKFLMIRSMYVSSIITSRTSRMKGLFASATMKIWYRIILNVNAKLASKIDLKSKTLFTGLSSAVA